uniref:DUF7869 domain-containing protein n=1 Tax=Magallana gigas TaxID=29159 RepID=A0A8W8MM29_MAGGI
MVSESQVEFPEPVSYSHFLRLWREEASYIAIPKIFEMRHMYVLAFMAYLVERKIFRKVKISFLMVGHTHEDVDQVFSKPTSIRTSDVYNITEWLTPHINAIKNHSRPHVFKITSDESGKARLFWKEWSTDKKWNETTEYILKSDVEGEPDIVVPFFDEIHDNIDRLENDVKTSFKCFAKEEDKEWWYCFFRNYDAPNDTNLSWPLEDLAAEKRKKHSHASEEELGDPFTFHLQEETPIPPVVIGKGSSASKPRAVSNDDFVLVDIPKYAGEWPQLCQVINVAGDQFTVHWYRGSRTTAWTPCKRRIQGTRGKQEAWTEIINKQQIWSSAFKLTPSGHIPKKIRDELESYEHYYYIFMYHP